MIPERLSLAGEYLADAQSLLAAERCGSAASRAYYAAYQAMWAALGDPPAPDGRWHHEAIINHFVRGYWFQPTHPPRGPGLLEPLRLPLRRLYQARLDADYDRLPIPRARAEEAVQTAQQTLTAITQRTQGELP
jgi:hypothetical protein